MRNMPPDPLRPELFRQTPEERTQDDAAPDYPVGTDESADRYELDYVEPDPAPVYLVPSPMEVAKWVYRSAGTFTATTTPVQVSGGERRRLRSLIRNLDDTNNVVIGDSRNTTAFMSYLIPPGAESEIKDHSPLWISSEADTVRVSVLSEYESSDTGEG